MVHLVKVGIQSGVVQQPDKYYVLLYIILGTSGNPQNSRGLNPLTSSRPLLYHPLPSRQIYQICQMWPLARVQNIAAERIAHRETWNRQRHILRL